MKTSYFQGPISHVAATNSGCCIACIAVKIVKPQVVLGLTHQQVVHGHRISIGIWDRDKIQEPGYGAKVGKLRGKSRQFAARI